VQRWRRTNVLGAFGIGEVSARDSVPRVDVLPQARPVAGKAKLLPSPRSRAGKEDHLFAAPSARELESYRITRLQAWARISATRAATIVMLMAPTTSSETTESAGVSPQG